MSKFTVGSVSSLIEETFSNINESGEFPFWIMKCAAVCYDDPQKQYIGLQLYEGTYDAPIEYSLDIAWIGTLKFVNDAKKRRGLTSMNKVMLIKRAMKQLDLSLNYLSVLKTDGRVKFEIDFNRMPHEGFEDEYFKKKKTIGFVINVSVLEEAVADGGQPLPNGFRGDVARAIGLRGSW